MTTRSSGPSDGRALEPRQQLDALPGLRDLLDDLRLWPDLEHELDECVPPRFASPTPTGRGVYFSVEEVRRYLEFCRRLRHFKGPLAGRKLIPDLWQVLYIDAPLYGWRKPDGNRVFTTLWEEIPRKNGKSTSSAGKGLYHLTADSNLKRGRLFEPGAEVYAAAATTRQAKEVFRPAEEMARRSPSLAKRLGIEKEKALVYERSASRFEVLSGVSDRAEEKMGLNSSCNIIDEVHVHKSRKLIDTLDSSTAAREQPLTAFITTAGVDDPGSIYTEKRDYAEKVAKRELEDDSWLVCVYTIDDDDDPFDPATWRKANPGLHRSVQYDYLERKAREAKNQPAALNTFLRLHLNRRTGQVTRWMPLDRWDRSGAVWLRPEWADLRGRTAYGGLDLASAVDLAAAAFVLPRWEVMEVPEDPDDPDSDLVEEEVEVLDVVIRAWTPAASLAERAQRDRAPYEQWVKDRLVATSPGEVIDYDQIELDLYDIADHLELERLHFDRWGSKQITAHLRDGGLNVVEMGQGFASFSAPMKETMRLVLQQRVAHGANPLLRWAVGALAVVQDSTGNIKPDRSKSTGRIDPFVALVMAIDAWSRDTRGESIYEDRGLEAV